MFHNSLKDNNDNNNKYIMSLSLLLQSVDLLKALNKFILTQALSPNFWCMADALVQTKGITLKRCVIPGDRYKAVSDLLL